MLYFRIGRHSKSLDVTKKVCGYCRGTFELLVNPSGRQRTPQTPRTPRTPNKFAMYVKEHYGEIKQKDSSLKHKDIMQQLSTNFAQQNSMSMDSWAMNDTMMIMTVAVFCVGLYIS